MTDYLEAVAAQLADGLAREYRLDEDDGTTATQPTKTAHATDHAGVRHMSMKGERR